MTSTPPKLIGDEILGESWIELCSNASSGIGSGSIFYPKSPERTTPLSFSTGDEYLRLLREAQRESNQSSCVVSLAGSRRDTPHSTPKSPPNSPNTEFSHDEELKNAYINYNVKDADKKTDWISEWSSRPDQIPPKDWKFEHPQRKTAGYSIRLARVGKNSLFSREVLYSLILTNVLSLILGAGLGLWLSKRGLIITRITID